MCVKTFNDAITSTEDLTILCSSCKQNLLDCNTVNGELELCMDLQVLNDSIARNKLSELDSEKVLRSTRKKPQPFYHELDDSMCSSLTEFTNTESSQGCEMPSDMESFDSEQDSQRPAKRRKLDSEVTEETENQGLIEIKNRVDSKKAQDLMDNLKTEIRYIFNPLSLLQLIINAINVKNIPDYSVENYKKDIINSVCKRCDEKFQNMKLLAIHEAKHLDVDLGDKIDDPELWDDSKEYADIRNKWYNYSVEKQTNYTEVDMELETDLNEQNLLIPINNVEMKEDYLPDEQRVQYVDEKPFAMGLPLKQYTREQRKAFYPTIRIGNVNRKFCHLCRYSFKDSWAIEGHYFSLACIYTCKYCGMRFNKYRQSFGDHVNAHQKRGDPISTRTFAASKTNTFVPKELPDKSKKAPVKAPPPPVPAKANNRRSVPAIKEEPPKQKFKLDSREVIQKSSNQAYFCRKCYKVFFKLDEFTMHSKNCDYNQFGVKGNGNKFAAQSKATARHGPGRPPGSKTQKPAPTVPVKPKINVNGDSTPSGRPLRNCVKEVTYKDDVNIAPLAKETNPSPSSSAAAAFMCFVCNTSFPTVYSRNSHMRIHKGERMKSPPLLSQQPLISPRTKQNHLQSPIKQEPLNDDYEVKVKEEPLEPMVEIYENERNVGMGAVSITPIVKNPNKKPTINPNIMKLVQNNPNLTIKKTPEKLNTSGSFTNNVANNSNNSSVSSNNSNILDDRSYKCSSCGGNFANKSRLYFHKKNQCEGSRFPCPFCKKRFGTESAYSSHIFYSHPE